MPLSWGYSTGNGPATWAKKFPSADGKNQSPVDIAGCVYDSALAGKPLVASGPKDSGFVVENTGCGFKANTSKSKLSGGPLNGTYTLAQFHVHWGSDDQHGAEHTVNGKKYAAELHSVYWNTEKFKTFAEALNKDDGVCIVAALIQAGAEHAGFKVITDCLAGIQKQGTNVEISVEFDPNCLFPANTKDYWTYQGSLTNPPCSEKVTWIIFSEILQYSSAQLAALRSLQDADSKPLTSNHRPLFDIGEKTISASFQ